MKLIIAGSRNINPTPEYMDDLMNGLQTFHQRKITSVISGRARGVDRAGEAWAKRQGIPVDPYPADWTLGKRAGHLRNEQMARAGDALVLIWDGKSKGSASMLKFAKKYKLLVQEVIIP